MLIFDEVVPNASVWPVRLSNVPSTWSVSVLFNPEPPKIGSLAVTGYGDHMIARYEIESKVTLGDEIELRYGPRLTVFRKGIDGTWLVVAHANMAAIER